MQLIVLGMHRSGTSGVTRLLNMAGAWFGPEGIATDANDENPKGFWERRDVRAVCDGLLHGAGADWWRISGFAPDAIPDAVRDEHLTSLRRILLELDAHRPWVVKEPRLCLLFPLIRPLLEVPVCIHVTREPLEVAQSVHARGDLSVQGALALWEAYTLAAFQASAGLPRLHVRHEDVMADPVAATRRLLADLADLGVQGLRIPGESEITAFISPELHRQRRSADHRGLRLNAGQAELASAIDTGTILEIDTFAQLSEGSVEQLVLLEEAVDQRATISSLTGTVDELMRTGDELTRAVDDRTREVEQLARTVDARTRDADAATARSRQVTRAAVDALDRAERDVRAITRSRAWRLGDRLAGVRRRFTPGMSGHVEGPVARALVGIEQGRRDVDRTAGTPPAATAAEEPAREAPQRPVADPQPVEAAPAPAGPSTARKEQRRHKIAVIAWDVGHNPLGRANVLAEVLARRFEVEVWGAQFERYGRRTWPPLEHSAVPVHVFEGRRFPEHLDVVERVAREIDADAVYVSKPRLPSYLLGAMAKEARQRPLVLDVDDHELAFFAEDEGIDIASLATRKGARGLEWPFERAWTQACDPLIGAADGLTVSNVALQRRYGGIVFPHARDEQRFDPDLYDRSETRQLLGLAPEQRLLLFGGTPRVHKGVVEVLRALDRIGDDRYRAVVFGTRELEELHGEIGGLHRWAIALPYQPFDDLARIVGAMDLACVLQDPAHPVARYQMPAKITDALAMAVPCLVASVPPVQPLIERGVLQVLEQGADLAEVISGVFDDYGSALDRAHQGRKVFLESYSYAAVSEMVTPVFEELIADPPVASAGLATLTAVPRSLYAGRGRS